MCHATGQLTDRLHLLALDDLRLKRLEFGRVRQDRDDLYPLGRRDAAEGDAQKHLFVGTAHMQNLGRIWDGIHGDVHKPILQRPPQPLKQVGEIARRLNRTQHVAGELVDRLNFSVGVQRDDPDRQPL